MKNTYKIDFITNTLIVTKAFEEQANTPGSTEYNLLQQLRTDFPGIQIVRKTRRTPKKSSPNKNLTYENMVKYMSVFKNADELLAQFEIVKTCSLKEANRYQYVKEWFVTQFPKYKELPDFGANTANVIDLAEFQQKMEMKKEA